ncbi:MAG: MarR family transcriptional regulator [Phenylobacterium sp.]|jgi:DNA-binding MarR family transcriptional regulator|nr:MarR family transcriptional regulator [Phenylobacterium sp.]
MSLDPDRLQGLADFRRALRKFLAASEAISKAGGVTQQQYQALLALRSWQGPPMTVGDLARELLLTHHGAVQLVDRLALAGYMARTASGDDRRKVELGLTDAGRQTLDALAELHLTEILRQEPQLAQSLRKLRKASTLGERQTNSFTPKADVPKVGKEFSRS